MIKPSAHLTPAEFCDLAGISDTDRIAVCKMYDKFLLDPKAWISTLQGHFAFDAARLTALLKQAETAAKRPSGTAQPA